MAKILVEQDPSPMKLEVMHVEQWDIWEKEISRFPWTYDAAETCYVLEGEAVVTPDNGDPVTISAGDLVVFMAGLSCVWEIKKPIRKHYKMG
jgi:uncharacterized cupin superfamily protein